MRFASNKSPQVLVKQVGCQSSRRGSQIGQSMSPRRRPMFFGSRGSLHFDYVRGSGRRHEEWRTTDQRLHGSRTPDNLRGSSADCCRPSRCFGGHLFDLAECVHAVPVLILSKTACLNHAGIWSVFISSSMPSVTSASHVCSCPSPELSKMYARFVLRIASMSRPSEA